MDKEWKYKLCESRIINLKETEVIVPLVKCSICLDIFWQAKSCNNCQHNFCDICISDYI